MKVYPVSYITNKIKLYTNLSKLWIPNYYPAQQLMQLDNSMSICGVYNVETLEKLINIVHNIQNTSSHERLITQLHVCTSAIRILAKGYLPISLVTPLKLREILNEVKTAIWKTNPDYDLVIDRLCLYYNMQLVTFGIDKNKTLIIQFPVFIQPYTPLPLILYQLETVPVPIIDQNTQAQSYTHL